MRNRVDLIKAYDKGMSDAYADSMLLRRVENPYTDLEDADLFDQYELGRNMGVQLIRAEIALYGDR